MSIALHTRRSHRIQRSSGTRYTNLRAATGLSCFALLLPLCAGQTPGVKWFDGLGDVSLYLKPKYNLVNQWDQEFGILAVVARYGNWSAVTNFAYDPYYPIRFDQEPRFTAGMQFTYTFLHQPIGLGAYTKPKYNFENTWKEESGITSTFFRSRRLVISSNVAYVWNYPYVTGQKPSWLALVNFQFPL